MISEDIRREMFRPCHICGLEIVRSLTDSLIESIDLFRAILTGNLITLNNVK